MLKSLFGLLWRRQVFSSGFTINFFVSFRDRVSSVWQVTTTWRQDAWMLIDRDYSRRPDSLDDWIQWCNLLNIIFSWWELVVEIIPPPLPHLLTTRKRDGRWTRHPFVSILLSSRTLFQLPTYFNKLSSRPIEILQYLPIFCLSFAIDHCHILLVWLGRQISPIWQGIINRLLTCVRHLSLSRV